jgi:hypothetical protein
VANVRPVLVRLLACAFVAFVAASASADTQAGSLAADASAAALYQVTCSDDGSGPPASLAVSVRDTAPAAAPLVGVQIQKATAATSATDAADGDAIASPTVFVNGGAGVYDVFVDKTDAGAESFLLFFQCTTGANGTGDPTGTSVFPSAPEVPLLPALGWIALAALLALTAPLRASAHSLNETLGADASATDLVQIFCSDNGSGAPQSLAVDVRDNAPAEAALVSVQVQRGSALVNATDPVDGDAGLSPHVAVNGGAGAYDVLVDKSAAGAESYSLSFHCMTGPDGTGVHTGTASTLVQDQ